MEGLSSSKAPRGRPNRKTGENTSKGRPVWLEGSTGELYSERSITFPVKEGESQRWFTVPTVAEDGTQYEEDVVREYVEKNGAIDWITGEVFPSFKSEEEAVNYAKERSGALLEEGYATGGVVTMNKMYDEGGLATDGMDTDPVSGNEIPVGSNAEDVRDDVDAKLSSGEYVVPADVVKYLGVAQLEKLVDKAKAGLEDMEKNGRIGGAPEEEPEEVVMTLGGDLATLDGYAAGGLVPGTDVNGIIDRVKAAAMKDPSIVNLLKSKGIFVQAPEQGEAAVAPAIQGQATPQKFAEGGTVEAPNFKDYNTSGDYASAFNPNQYTPGYSIAAGVPAPTGGLCPPGYRYDPNKQECIPLSAEDPAEVDTGIKKEPERDDASSVEEERDPNSWMSKYDYTDPDTLVSQTMTTLGQGEAKEQSGLMGLINKGAEGLMGMLGGGILGKAINSGKYSEAVANAAALSAMGLTEQAQSVQAAADKFAKDNKLNTKGFFVSKTMTQRALDKLTEDGTLKGGGKPTRGTSTGTGGGGGGRRPVTPTVTDEGPGSDPAPSRPSKATPGSEASYDLGGRSRARSAVSDAGSVSRDTARSMSGSQMSAGTEVGSAEDGSDYAGPMAKGGLVAKRTKVKKTTKPMSNKKGLGRR